MPENRPTWPDPAPGMGPGKLDALLRNRETHQDLMREELELEHLAREGRPPRPSPLERLRRVFHRD